ncbi:hypothetical protein CONCODRAFT_4949 [Conidiobolus coronatus NRRL 28638]|uniref:Uncharacterized protein n=1 Tax=Conidiobolus coronatus (strain ATCC 28846 / CBS 209.66 / NRRL 28638) TaxID=796925 RepID=A0A137PBB6_CONC2|nr:hypothetical protein CONCODRAFT_4949 [Conidiobolus coronatus NRRL 28638]|eukprot:KXN72310.1 hypothetical protein CONCODRAFT_4949 [Conidiobolus coronatus NRRL 28638]
MSKLGSIASLITFVKFLFVSLPTIPLNWLVVLAVNLVLRRLKRKNLKDFIARQLEQ